MSRRRSRALHDALKDTRALVDILGAIYLNDWNLDACTMDAKGQATRINLSFTHYQVIERESTPEVPSQRTVEHTLEKYLPKEWRDKRNLACKRSPVSRERRGSHERSRMSPADLSAVTPSSLKLEAQLMDLPGTLFRLCQIVLTSGGFIRHLELGQTRCEANSSDVFLERARANYSTATVWLERSEDRAQNPEWPQLLETEIGELIGVGDVVVRSAREGLRDNDRAPPEPPSRAAGN